MTYFYKFDLVVYAPPPPSNTPMPTIPHIKAPTPSQSYNYVHVPKQHNQPQQQYQYYGGMRQQYRRMSKIR